jgi:hypothetical protein
MNQGVGKQIGNNEERLKGEYGFFLHQVSGGGCTGAVWALYGRTFEESPYKVPVMSL